MDATDLKLTKDVNDSIVKNGYEFLRELCAFNADINSFTKNLNPISNRVEYIMHQLDAQNITYKVDKFQPLIGTPDFVEGQPAEVNIIVEFEGNNKEATTVFTSHHDVANRASENAQDNSASVSNLLDLCVQLSKERPANNVVVCFNDSEERVSTTTSGAARISKQILAKEYGNVTKILVLELTGNGRNYWMSFYRSNMENKPQIRRVRTPFSDTATFETHNLPSICIGSLSEGDMDNVIRRGFCRTWALCHSENDKFENANEGDMTAFVLFLKTLI